METCYKAVRTPLLQSIPIRSRDFRIEPELTFKLAKRGARIFEVPICYAGRTYDEGKKIGFRDALLALGAMLHWWLIDDIYQPDEYGSDILVAHLRGAALQPLDGRHDAAVRRARACSRSAPASAT